MWLYALASFVMGWALPSCFAYHLLAKRGLRSNAPALLAIPAGSTTTGRFLLTRCNALLLSLIRLLTAYLTGAFAFVAWQLLSPTACVLATLGFTCLLIMVICDLGEQVIPWEPCAFLFVLACFYQVFSNGLLALASSAASALAITATLLAANAISHALSRGDAIGHGDLRAIPAVCIFAGPLGTALGGIACSLSIGVQALVTCIRTRGQPPRHLPMGVAICLWFSVGILAQELF